MAEELVLTTPVTVPGYSTTKYIVESLFLSMTYVSPESGAAGPGMIEIQLHPDGGLSFTHRYLGQVAKDFIKFLNTANLSTKSLNKRILEKLASDGVIPGTVQGSPDP